MKITIYLNDRTPTLAEVMAALDAVRDAVSRGDVAAYRTAMVHAESLGCTDEQLTDAYDYAAARRRGGASFSRDAWLYREES
jgi:hypothetical protein